MRSYGSPFQRHLAFFDRDNDGFVYLGESLRGCLSIGLDFPAALSMAVGFQILYGNTRPFFFGPFRGIEVSRVTNERTMLQDVPIDLKHNPVFSRKELSTVVRQKGFMDRAHIFGLWALAADGEGKVSRRDIELCQAGMILPELERRRKTRSDVLPLYRGGPISVAGHSWAVDRVFGVKVYQKESADAKDR